MGNEVELKLAVTPKFADLLHQELTNFRILAITQSFWQILITIPRIAS